MYIKVYWNPVHPRVRVVYDPLLPAVGAVAELSCDGVPAEMNIFIVWLVPGSFAARAGSRQQRTGRGSSKERAWLRVGGAHLDPDRHGS